MSPVTDIRNFHAHVYFDPETQVVAERVRGALERLFAVVLGTVHARPVGPHPKGMFQVTIAPDQFASVVPWLMLNRDGLSILVHPTTDDAVADHESNLLWMGESLPLDVEMVRRFVEHRKQNEKKQMKEEGFQ